MSMEGFNPEPATPDESELIEDIDKARAMAESGDANREEAARLRKEAEETDNRRSEGHMMRPAEEALANDSIAEEKEETAGIKYDEAQ